MSVTQIIRPPVGHIDMLPQQDAGQPPPGVLRFYYNTSQQSFVAYDHHGNDMISAGGGFGSGIDGGQF